jgi:hypothetical protein
MVIMLVVIVLGALVLDVTLRGCLRLPYSVLGCKIPHPSILKKYDQKSMKMHDIE